MISTALLYGGLRSRTQSLQADLAQAQKELASGLRDDVARQTGAMFAASQSLRAQDGALAALLPDEGD